MRVLKKLFFVVSLSISCTVYCQDNNQSAAEDQVETIVLDDTVVEASYTVENISSGTKTDTPLIEIPQSISVINRDQLDARGVATFNEALRYTPGIQPEPFGFEPRFTNLRIRGFNAATTGLFRDGLVLGNPDFTVSYNLEPWGAEQIEILKGPSSSLFGQGSSGGLINYVSKRPLDEEIREVVFEYGSFDRKQAKFDVTGNVNSDTDYSYRLVGLYLDSDTQVDFLPFDRQYLAPSFDWQITPDTKLTVLGSYQHDETLNSQALPEPGTLTSNPGGVVPLSRFTGEPGVDSVDRSEFSLGYEFEHNINSVLSFRQNTRYNYVDLDDTVVFSNGIAGDLRTINRGVFANFGTLNGFTIDNQVEANISHGIIDHQILFGIDYQDITSESIQSFGAAPTIDIFNPVYGAAVTIPAPFRNDEIDQNQFGLYFQDQIRLQNWLMTIGGRYDNTENETTNRLTNTTTKQDDDAFTGRIGLSYQSPIGLAPYISYSESFLPNFGTDANGNELKSEETKQYEAGIKYQPPGIDAFITFAAFEITRENFTETDPATFLTVQTGEVRSSGFEIEAVANLDFGLDLVASYSNMEVEVTESVNPLLVGNRITQVPDELASLRADYNFRGGLFDGLRIGAGVRYHGSTFGNAANTIKVASFTVYDAGIHYDWKNIRFGVTAQNIFDEDYVASCFARAGANFCTFGELQNVRGTVSILF